MTRRPQRYAVSTRWEREVAEHGPIKDFHRFFCCCARRLGNMFVLCERSDGSPVVIAGPCWPFCVFVTLPLILSISAAVAYFVIISDDSPLVSEVGGLLNAVTLSSWVCCRSSQSLPTHQFWGLMPHQYAEVQPLWVAYIYFPVLGFVLASLFCVSCQDPGLMERVTDEEAGEGGWFWNEQVGSFRPPGALYCRECGVLIQDYDHLYVHGVVCRRCCVLGDTDGVVSCVFVISNHHRRSRGY
jgi:hypothetical protein